VKARNDKDELSEDYAPTHPYRNTLAQNTAKKNGKCLMRDGEDTFQVQV